MINSFQFRFVSFPLTKLDQFIFFVWFSPKKYIFQYLRAWFYCEVNNNYKNNYLIIKRSLIKFLTISQPFSEYVGEVTDLWIAYIWKLGTITAHGLLKASWFLKLMPFLVICFLIGFEVNYISRNPFEIKTMMKSPDIPSE